MWSRLKKGSRKSLRSPWSFAISHADAEKPPTLRRPEFIQPSHKMINDDDNDNKQNKDDEIEERTETQQNVKFHFQAAPNLFQKSPRQLSTPSTIKLFPEPKIRFSKSLFNGGGSTQ